MFLRATLEATLGRLGSQENGKSLSFRRAD
jgi:hypothetical protein